MSDFYIRLYKDSDYKVARQLFNSGNAKHTKKAFKHAMRQPHIWPPLLALLILPALDIVSFTTSIFAVVGAIVFLWFAAWRMYWSYVRLCFLDDMLDIRRYYLEQDGRCFWVAESGGQVVGTIAASPSSYPGGENHVELKRLSVSPSHRGKGIAKALCRTMIDFARHRGCKAVVLTTSLVQKDARKMYDKMGFRLTHNFYRPKPFTKLLDFKILFYQYDIPKLQ
ncbi:PREDICTED: N-acetyltransferase 8-like [Nanorana parkeri]|uniref:N-acetyltransferase 8-like n=1 Tax=Nanorana parkeri TaxID=125878 RepID=UPI000854A3EA|nr:PREDICTED: N-acetyltransferase 8-like [Nanorana parkeri]